MKKILTLFLILFIFTTGMIIPTKKADAITVLGISGVADVVIDPINIGTSVAGWTQEWARFALEKAGEIIVATLKKRLLDRIVNQTIEWIQGNGDPRFVRDTGGFFQDAADAALGDTIQEIGLGDLCSSSLSTKIRVQLEQPTFRDNVSCTLSSAFGNVEGAVEQFGEDFRSGSWIAYNEVLKPQNNSFGLRIMTQVELAKRQSEQQQEAEQRLSSGGGFLDDKICTKWEKEVDPAEGVSDFPLAPVSGEDYYKNAPNESGTAPSSVEYNGSNRPEGANGWVCAQSETITPGSTIADSVSQSLGSDIDFIVNSDDLSTYVSAIADALINRLTSEAISGLAGVYDSTRGSDSRGTTTTDCEDLGPPGDPAREACEDSEDHQGDIEDASDEGIDDLDGYRDEANDQSDRSGTIAACDDLPNTGDAREECREQFKNAENEIDVGSPHVVSVGTSHAHTGVTITSPGNNLDRYAWFFNSCPDGNCPTLSNDSGEISGGEVEIEGPTYTPDESGIYELMIEVIDEDGDISTSTLKEDTYGLDMGSSNALTSGVQYEHDTATIANPNGNLSNYFWSFNSCPGTCPSISSGESGTITNTGSTIPVPGPTFMPNEEGFLELVLEVTDNSGNSITDRIILEVQ